QALAVGQAHVGEAEVVLVLVQEPDRFRNGLRARGVESHARERELEELEQVRLVVDDEDLRLAANSPGHVAPPSTVSLRSGVDARLSVMRKCAPGPLGNNSSAAPLAS